MAWDIRNALNYARHHASAQSQGKCAHFVSEAIRAGGANLRNTPDAKNMGPNLMAAGFKRVYGDPKKGDVAVIQSIPGHSHGHACIYDGNGIWYSDFVQRTMYPGSGYRELKPEYQLYRHD